MIIFTFKIYIVKQIVTDMAPCRENGHSDMESNKFLLFFRRERHIGTAPVWTITFWAHWFPPGTLVASGS